ncbi:hypothetical protein DUI87_16418 [Hirundo rustica rustica]|uniref:Mitotic spindle organizing protein 1 n=4 Tax=Passeriformes TaxID=9126 RepID=A0A3M0K1F4_HIRRU|nr:hypothetical protein DUI87_16418 [Hirundo rustica rustica]
MASNAAGLNAVRETMDVLFEISRILNTGLDMETLSICVRLCEQGINPEALSSVIKELRKATEALKCHMRLQHIIDFKNILPKEICFNMHKSGSILEDGIRAEFCMLIIIGMIIDIISIGDGYFSKVKDRNDIGPKIYRACQGHLKRVPMGEQLSHACGVNRILRKNDGTELLKRLYPCGVLDQYLFSESFEAHGESERLMKIQLKDSGVAYPMNVLFFFIVNEKVLDSHLRYGEPGWDEPQGSSCPNFLGKTTGPHSYLTKNEIPYSESDIEVGWGEGMERGRIRKVKLNLHILKFQSKLHVKT